MDRLARGLEIDPGIRRQHQPQLGAADKQVSTRDVSQFRQQRAKRRIRCLKQPIRPQCVLQLVAIHRPDAMGRQIREQQPPLASGKLVL